MPSKKEFCDNKAQGGWLGFTDKYWMSALIPDANQSINVNYRYGNNGRDSYKSWIRRTNIKLVLVKV